MSEGKDEIRIERKTKAEMQALKQKKLEIKADKAVKVTKAQPRSPKEKMPSDQKSRIVALNIVQIVILAFAILVEVLSLNEVIPKEFSLVGLLVLTISCVLIMKKINKIMKE